MSHISTPYFLPSYVTLHIIYRTTSYHIYRTSYYISAYTIPSHPTSTTYRTIAHHTQYTRYTIACTIPCLYYTMPPPYTISCRAMYHMPLNIPLIYHISMSHHIPYIMQHTISYVYHRPYHIPHITAHIICDIYICHHMSYHYVLSQLNEKLRLK
ncbi:hypothetical protein WUBG_01837, partial [Wuchereria bancrofti]